MSQWNTLSVPLGSSWQCTLVPAGQYLSPSGDTVRFMRDDDEIRQLEEDRQDFDRSFRPCGDLRTVSGGAELREIQSFLTDALNVVHWDLPIDNVGVERMLRRAVACGRLVPVVNRDYGCLGRVSRPTPAPLRWPSSGDGWGGGSQKWSAFANAGPGPLMFDGEPVLSGPYDPATREAQLIAARRAMTAIDGGDLLSVLETVAAAARGIDSGADGTAEDGTAEGGDDVADDRGETSSPLGGAQSFEYGEDAPAGDVEQLAGGEGTPGNNQAQNKRFKAVVKAMGLDQRQARQLHDEISGEGLGYHEIMERAQDMFGASE
jgi:hypothetical protein